MAKTDTTLINRILAFMEDEARSCSMDPSCITPEYVYRMRGERVPFEEIQEAMDEARRKK